MGDAPTLGSATVGSAAAVVAVGLGLEASASLRRNSSMPGGAKPTIVPFIESAGLAPAGAATGRSLPVGGGLDDETSLADGAAGAGVAGEAGAAGESGVDVVEPGVAPAKGLACIIMVPLNLGAAFFT